MISVFYAIIAIVIMSLATIAAISDFRTGLISNKVLLFFTGIGIVFDAVYYGLIETDYRIDFVLNLLVVMLISLVLFYSHSLAGGDCKLLIVLALLYPAAGYIDYEGSLITLSLIIAFSILYGYIYLLISSLINLLTDKTHVPKGYVLQSLKMFANNYIKAIVYISLLTIVFQGLALWGICVPNTLITMAYFVFAWIVGRAKRLKSKRILLPIVAIVVAFSVGFGFVPISTYPKSYIQVALLMMCQMAIRTNLYKGIPLTSLKKGMILSMPSSMLFQHSRVRGLPGISFEDLRSRLTESEVDSIFRWASQKEVSELVIVKKIPFAIFILFGVVSYFILWGMYG